jgi:hypothetical protein
LESAPAVATNRRRLAARVFELSQSLTEKWITADYAEKRQILEWSF